MPSLILLLEGSERHTYPLGKATLMVGRDSTSDLQLPSTSISANHASIVFQDGEFVLRDNGSPNGSYVNGEKVTRRALGHHDLIRFGEYSFLIDLEDDQGLEVDEKGKQTPSKDEIDEEKTGEYVPAAKSKRRYSEVVHVKHPKTEKLGTITGSPALELRLTEPVPYTMVTAVKRLPPQPVAPEPTLGSKLLKVIAFAAVGVVGMLLTLFLLPLNAREAVVNSDGFQNVPFHRFLHGLLIREGMEFYTVSLKQGEPPFGIKMTVPRTSRLAGDLRFTQKTSAPMKLRISIRRVGEESKPVFDQLVDIKSDTETLPLFSLTVKPGIYTFEGVCEQEAFLGQSSAIFQVKSYY